MKKIFLIAALFISLFAKGQTGSTPLTFQGKGYPILGTLYYQSFGSLPSGWAANVTNTTLTYSSGHMHVVSTDNQTWNDYIEYSGAYFNYDKGYYQITLVAGSRTSTSYGIGITFGQNSLNFSTSIRSQYNLSSTADSGSTYISYDAGSRVVQSTTSTITSGDTVVIRLSRDGMIMGSSIYDKSKNIKVSTPPYYNGSGFGTGGKFRISFLGGTFDVVNVSYYSSNQTGTGTIGIASDSQGAEDGPTVEATTWPMLTVRQVKARLNNFSHPSITALSWATSDMPYARTIGTKKWIFMIGYNDRRDLINDTTTFRQRIDSCIAPLLRDGDTIILNTLVPSPVGGLYSSTDIFSTCITNIVTYYKGLGYYIKLADIRTALMNGYAGMSPNYVYSDNIHLSDSGAYVVWKTNYQVASELFTVFQNDTVRVWTISNLAPISEYSQLIGIDGNGQPGIVSNLHPDDTRFIRAQTNINGTFQPAFQPVSLAVKYPIYGDSALFLSSAVGGLVNFSNATNSTKARSYASNFLLTNETYGGTNYNPSFNNTFTTAARLNMILKVLDSANTGSYATGVSGIGNTGLGSLALAQLSSGGYNVEVKSGISVSSITTGSHIINIGESTGNSTTSNSITIGYAASGWGNTGNRIHIGWGDYGAAASGETVLAPQLNGTTYLYAASKGMYSGSLIIRAPFNYNLGNSNGFEFDIDASAGYGSSGVSGALNLRNTTVGSTTSGNPQTNYVNRINIAGNTTTINSILKLDSTQASSSIAYVLTHETDSSVKHIAPNKLIFNYAHNITTPSNGGTVSLTNNNYNIINPSGSLSTLTVNLPSSPADKDVVYIKFTQAITTVTYGNGTVVGGITSPSGGTVEVLTYDSSTTSWY